MQTEDELNEAIVKITMKIRNEHPELLKYLNELTVTLPDVNNPEVTRKLLQDYYNSLDTLLKKYKPTHTE